MKKVTLATIKSFIKKNHGKLFINSVSSFDGMVDCVVYDRDSTYSPVEYVEDIGNNLGIKGVWFVLRGGDRFYPVKNENFEGYEIYNCCGSFILATKV